MICRGNLLYQSGGGIGRRKQNVTDQERKIRTKQEMIWLENFSVYNAYLFDNGSNDVEKQNDHAGSSPALTTNSFLN